METKAPVITGTDVGEQAPAVFMINIYSRVKHPHFLKCGVYVLENLYSDWQRFRCYHSDCLSVSQENVTARTHIH